MLNSIVETQMKNEKLYVKKGKKVENCYDDFETCDTELNDIHDGELGDYFSAATKLSNSLGITVQKSICLLRRHNCRLQTLDKLRHLQDKPKQAPNSQSYQDQ